MTLALIIAIPLLGAALVLALRRSAPLARIVALGASVATILPVALVIRAYLASGEPLTQAFSGAVGAFVRFSADGLSLPLVALTALLGVVVVLVSWNAERVAAHLALLLALEAAVMAVFLAADLVLFYVAWEAVLVPMFFLIGGWGHEHRRRAAVKFFTYTFAGSALMLVGIIIAVLSSGSHALLADGSSALGSRETLVFWLLAAGLLVKVPAWPLHTWLPDAHVEAPTSGSIMLAGVLLKMGGYGLARLGTSYTPDAFAEAAPAIAALGVIGIVYGAAVALGQTDLKRLVAYSSVAHMGFVLLALSAGSVLGVQAAVLGMVSHGLVAGLLFLLAGAAYDRAHTHEMAEFGGLGAMMPAWAGMFVFASLASLGLPGLSGFPGEFGALLAAFTRYGWPVAVAGLGVVLAGAYNLRAVWLMVFGGPRFPKVSTDGGQSAPGDLSGRELLAVALLGVPVVAIGLWPRLVTALADPAVTSLVRALAEGR